VALTAPLSDEDQAAQSMPDASPTKWHLAHTTWFFETFVLTGRAGHQPFDDSFSYLFNSYYETLGPRQPRPSRGLLTRPPVQAVMAYRRHVDLLMDALLQHPDLTEAEQDLILLGLAHEQQHQELLLTDILHLFAQNPLQPAYDPDLPSLPIAGAVDEAGFVSFDGGVVQIGRAVGGEGFAFDNESPRHEVFLHPYRLADRLVTNGEWISFMADGGYARPEFWLSDGWARAQDEGWTAPLYWRRSADGSWISQTLAGPAPVQADAPVTHISYYEADAYARWAGLRLPTEAEWENAVVQGGETPQAPSGALRPLPAAAADGGLRQLYGDCWQWTSSAYAPYPGFKSAAGAVGEYNGKFMINQMVLRGGSCATPPGHLRNSYRNFFHPDKRWQFCGLRLADDAPPKRATAPIADSGFRRDVVDGLSRPQKSIPSKYFYDEAGSALFEAICDLEEYYPTRTETALLAAIAPALAAVLPAGAALVEFGSGASTKTRILLDAAPSLAAYAPIDISADALKPAAEAIAKAYPDLIVAPIVGDFTRPVSLPQNIADLPRVGFFPGSTIGNFTGDEALDFLGSAKAMLGEGAHFIIGVDLVKSPAVLVAAYDDAAGVTRDFNKNLLVRINRELDGRFDLEAFSHRAVWNAADSRIEMHLVSDKAQEVMVAGRRFRFAEGESIHTENSHKHEPASFAALAAKAGWTLVRQWISPVPEFGVFLFRA
jgi:dimethylhistidine N-methyltransferase